VRVMIFSGPSAPKLMAEARVASENVGEGERVGEERFGDSARLRNERGLRGIRQRRVLIGVRGEQESFSADLR